MNRKKLVEKLKNPKYRHAFSYAQSRRMISAQIRALRQSSERGWTQKELGERAEMKQNAIARLENPDYGEYSVRTLQRLAEAFDVGLVVKFAPFSELVNMNQNASVGTYLPASFAHDTLLLGASPLQHQEQSLTSGVFKAQEAATGALYAGPTAPSAITIGNLPALYTAGGSGATTGGSVIRFVSDGSGSTQTLPGFPLSSINATQDWSNHAG